MKLSQLLAENPTLDHDIDLAEGDIVADLLTIARCVRFEDTDDMIIMGVTDTMTGVIQYGIVSSAKLQVERWMLDGHGD